MIDIDATLITSHSDKQGAAATYKRGYGFHPMLAYLDTPGLAAGGLPLAGLLRPGNAGANSAQDHIEVLDQALEVVPREVAADAEIVVRCDSRAPRTSSSTTAMRQGSASRSACRSPITSARRSSPPPRIPGARR